MFPHFDEKAEKRLLARGIPASPGAAVGKLVFDSDSAVKWASSGEDVILVRRETNPDDLNGMIAAKGILTSRGGKTSHAAVVARGMGKTCVSGAEELDVNTKQRVLRTQGGQHIEEGDVVSIDGTSGEVFLGAVPVVDSPVVRYFEKGTVEESDDLVVAVDRIMRHADDARRMAVRANADTTEDAARARRFGAQGIGLCRTEHMFLGERRKYVERLILAETPDERDKALAELLPLQREDFVGILDAMDGLPVTIRLLDPPLHEFLPDITDLSVRVAVAESRGEDHDHDLLLLQAVQKLHEQNPMLGLRGVRLGVVIPGLFEMQSRAILEAAAARIESGGAPRVEIMVPLVANVQEFETVKQDIIKVARDVRSETGVNLEFLIGTMIELPRAALTADQIAEPAEFFSFGTNDLTQTTWGFSRDDVEAAFFSAYLEKGIFGVSPFESIDVDGVGELVRIGSEKGRSRRPDLKLGVCGEHGGDPDSVHFFEHVGLDYVSCSPFRVPGRAIGRLHVWRGWFFAVGATSKGVKARPRGSAGVGGVHGREIVGTVPELGGTAEQGEQGVDQRRVD
jgi:pyruvate,orthophosphate dikinase